MLIPIFLIWLLTFSVITFNFPYYYTPKNILETPPTQNIISFFDNTYHLQQQEQHLFEVVQQLQQEILLLSDRPHFEDVSIRFEDVPRMAYLIASMEWTDPKFPHVARMVAFMHFVDWVTRHQQQLGQPQQEQEQKQQQQRRVERNIQLLLTSGESFSQLDHKDYEQNVCPLPLDSNWTKGDFYTKTWESSNPFQANWRSIVVFFLALAFLYTTSKLLYKVFSTKKVSIDETIIVNCKWKRQVQQKKQLERTQLVSSTSWKQQERKTRAQKTIADPTPLVVNNPYLGLEYYINYEIAQQIEDLQQSNPQTQQSRPLPNLQQLLIEIEDFKKTIIQLEEEKSLIKQQMRDLQSELDSTSAEATIKKLKASLEDVTEQLKKVEGQLKFEENQKRALAGLKAKQEQDLKKFRKEISKLEGGKEESKKQIRELEIELRKSLFDCAFLGNQKFALEEKVNFLDTRFKGNQMTIKELEASLIDVTEKLDEERGQKEALNEAKKKLSQELNQAISSLKIEREERGQQEQLAKNFAAALEAVKIKLEHEHKMRTELETQLQSLSLQLEEEKNNKQQLPSHSQQSQQREEEQQPQLQKHSQQQSPQRGTPQQPQQQQPLPQKEEVLLPCSTIFSGCVFSFDISVPSESKITLRRTIVRHGGKTIIGLTGATHVIVAQGCSKISAKIQGAQGSHPEVPIVSIEFIDQSIEAGEMKNEVDFKVDLSNASSSSGSNSAQ